MAMKLTIVAVLATALATAACSTTTGGSGQPAPRSTVAITVAQTSTQAAPATTDSVQLPNVPAQQITFNPCALVTQQEADKIAGVKVHKAVRAQESCMFATPTTGAVGQFEVYVGDGAKKAYDIDHTNLHHPFKTETGVADEAHLEDGAIFFRKGTTWVELRVLRLDGVNIGPALAAEARIAAGRMP
jgi:Protein of unknown function (DUF3558)